MSFYLFVRAMLSHKCVSELVAVFQGSHFPPCPSQVTSDFKCMHQIAEVGSVQGHHVKTDIQTTAGTRRKKLSQPMLLLPLSWPVSDDSK